MRSRLSLLAAAIVVSLSILEIGLRVLTPYPVTTSSNKADHPRLGYVNSSQLPDVDAHGFRNSRLTLEDAEVALVGDSMVWSVNVHSEESFAAELAARSGRRFYNMGV